MAYREGGNSNLSLKCRFYWLIISPMVSHPSYPCGNPVHRRQLFAKTNKQAQLDHLGYPHCHSHTKENDNILHQRAHFQYSSPHTAI